MQWLLWTMLACSGAPEPEPPPSAGQAAAPEEPPQPALPDPTEERYAASHILVAYAGAVGAPAGVTRTASEARERATALRDRALAGEGFEALARQHSDGPSAPRGGALGVYRTGTMVPSFERAVAAVAPGAIGPVAETPFGWHVVRREPIVEVHAAHVLVTWTGASRSAAARSKEEARARIEAAAAEIGAGVAFGEVVRRYSDDATAATGGDLGVIARGQMVPAFEDAAFGLEVGQVSDIVETPYGFHLVRRNR